MPIPFADMGTETGAKCRSWMWIHSYHIARPVHAQDAEGRLPGSHELAKLAATAGLSLEEFRQNRVSVENETPPPSGKWRRLR